MDAIGILTILSTVLILVNIFQWFDRRHRNKALHKFLEAAHDMSSRFLLCSRDKIAVEQKSRDMSSVLNAAIETVYYRKKKRNDATVQKSKKSK